MKKRIFNFMLPDDLRERIRVGSQKEYVKMSAFVIQAIIEKLERSEKSS